NAGPDVLESLLYVRRADEYASGHVGIADVPIGRIFLQEDNVGTGVRGLNSRYGPAAAIAEHDHVRLLIPFARRRRDGLDHMRCSHQRPRTQANCFHRARSLVGAMESTRRICRHTSVVTRMQPLDRLACLGTSNLSLRRDGATPTRS